MNTQELIEFSQNNSIDDIVLHFKEAIVKVNYYLHRLGRWIWLICKTDLIYIWKGSTHWLSITCKVSLWIRKWRNLEGDGKKFSLISYGTLK